MDSNKFLLVLVLLLCGATGYFAYKTSEEVKSLKEQLAVTESKVDSLMTATVKIAQSTKTVNAKKQPKSFWEELFSALEEDQKKTEAQAKAKAARETVTVSSAYRLDYCKHHCRSCRQREEDQRGRRRHDYGSRSHRVRSQGCPQDGFQLGF